MNKLKDSNITLNHKTHIYSLKDDPDFKFTSSTTFIHKFFEPFNKWKVAAKLLKLPKYEGMTRDELFADWKASSVRGTKIHAEMEYYIQDGTFPESIPGTFGQQWVDSAIPAHCELLPEVIVYSKEMGIAGMIDLLVYNPEDEGYTLVDWKTNKKINKNSFRGKAGIKPATLGVEDCNFNHYSLQLSLYRYMLEEYYGLKIKNQYLVHLTDAGAESLVCPYMKETIKEMLE